MQQLIQKQFAARATQVLETDRNVVGLAVAGSWLSGSLDEFSDLDLILVTAEKVSPDKEKMQTYAKRLGRFLSGFTGEHVGEPRVLICLYADPLLHVDIKFLTVDEFSTRIENPVILLDTENQLQQALDNSSPQAPDPDYQWIEDRFWIWVHYALLKIGRGECLEAYDFFGFLRMTVFGPLLQVKNGKPPRGVRKVEMELPPEDLKHLLRTLPACNAQALLQSLRNAVGLYRQLRQLLYVDSVQLQQETERDVMRYFTEIESK